MKNIFTKPIFWIIILASFLRLSLLTKVPSSLNWDEVSMGYSAYSILKTGADEWGSHLPIFFRSYGEWKSAVYIYLLVPFIKVFGNTALAIRLPSALAGIVSVYFTYLIGKLIYDKKVGLLASFLMSISPWALMLSRPAFEANLSLTLILIAIYFFLKFIHHHDSKSLILSSLFFGLAPHTYNSAKLVVPLLIIYLVISTQLYKSLKKLILPSLILLFFATPLILNLASGHAQARLTQVGVTTDLEKLSAFYNLRNNPLIPNYIGKLLINKVSFSFYQVTSNFFSYLSPDFLIISGATHNQHSLPFFGMLYLAEFAFFILGLIKLVSAKTNFKHSLRFLPIAMIILGILPAAATRDAGHGLRSILTLPAWQLLAAIGFFKLSHPLIKRFWIFLLGLQALIFIFLYFTWYPQVFARDWQYGYQQVAEYLTTHQGEYEHIVMTKWYGEPQLFLAFYNAWDPTWYQQHNFQNLRYESEGKLWLDQLTQYQLGKYTFKYLDWDNDKQPNTLYIGKFDDFGGGAKILKNINYPDGKTAFVIATQ